MSAYSPYDPLWDDETEDDILHADRAAVEEINAALDRAEDRGCPEWREP
jgi:hypothetical protein